MPPDFTPTGRTRLSRRPQRGHYDEATVFAILDAAVVCHIGYVRDGRPVVTPTAFWRDGRSVYWHGSAAGQGLQAEAGAPVCFTVSLHDGFLVGRSGFAHSILYRSVMAFGTPSAITDLVDKRRAMTAFLERLYPGRTAELRPIKDDELRQITVMRMELDEVSAKVRPGPVAEKEEGDYAVPCWAGTVPLATTIGKIEPDARLATGTAPGASLAAYAPGARLEDALRAAAAKRHPMRG
jgi:uncharacterized protein